MIHKAWGKPIVVAVCLAAVALSGCSKNIEGTASRDPDAEPWILPLGDDDLDGVLVDIDGVNEAVKASGLEFFAEQDEFMDTADNVTKPECVGAYSAGEQSVYQDSDYAAVEMKLAKEPDTDDPDHWVQQVVVLFPSAKEAGDFFAESEKSWEGCNQVTLDTIFDDSRHTWRIDDVVADETSMSQFSEQTDAAKTWNCDHTMSVVSNVIVEAIACSGDGPDQAAELNTMLVENATKH